MSAIEGKRYMASTASAVAGVGTYGDGSHRRHPAGVLTARAVGTSGGVVFSWAA